MSKTMTIKERLIHTTLFELGAVIAGGVLALTFSKTGPKMAIGAVVRLVSIAMVWNFVFNIGFDKVFKAPRESRSFSVRVLHTLLFKLGLMLASVPVMMGLFGLNFWQAVDTVSQPQSQIIFALRQNCLWLVNRLFF